MTEKNWKITQFKNKLTKQPRYPFDVSVNGVVLPVSKCVFDRAGEFAPLFMHLTIEVPMSDVEVVIDE